MAVMRQVLTRVIRDTTPPDKSMRHPLTKETFEDIRQCLALIAARERELADAAGVGREVPYYTDERPQARVVPIPSVKKRDPE
jgi:hypothetical protein